MSTHIEKSRDIISEDAVEMDDNDDFCDVAGQRLGVFVCMNASAEDEHDVLWQASKACFESNKTPDDAVTLPMFSNDEAASSASEDDGPDALDVNIEPKEFAQAG